MLNKSNQKAWDMAMLHKKAGNDGAFARSVSAMWRATNAKQQQAIQAAIIAADACGLFKVYNGCLVAKEG